MISHIAVVRLVTFFDVYTDSIIVILGGTAFGNGVLVEILAEVTIQATTRMAHRCGSGLLSEKWDGDHESGRLKLHAATATLLDILPPHHAESSVNNWI
jgi:hypothetical protein